LTGGAVPQDIRLRPRLSKLLVLRSARHKPGPPVPVGGVKPEFYLAAAREDALTFLPQFKQALSVQAVQFARPPGQGRRHRFWKAPMGRDGLKLLFGETFKKALVP
jgi:hypothetical protein